jgi:MtN3 and saliva related transmembrane protein
VAKPDEGCVAAHADVTHPRYPSPMFDLVLAWLVSAVGVATGIAYVPQAVRIWKRRSSDDVSILTYLLFLAGQLVYFVYGVRIAQWPLIIGMAANITGSLAVIGSAMKFRGRKVRDRVGHSSSLS